MYCLHCKYTTKLRNDKEINALFASATHGGVAVSAAPTKQTCTNITILPQIAKNFWRKIFSHRLHRYAQIRRVWHPCHTHAATKLSSHRIHGTHRNDWRRRKICEFCEIRGRLFSARSFCENLCNLWENILRLKLLCIL